MSNATIMLASPENPRKSLIDPDKYYMVSEKLDGVPVCITGQGDGKLTAVTRQGKPIVSIQHILDELMLHNEVPCMHDQTLVGELYIPGVPHKDIRGKVMAQRPAPDLKLYVFYPFTHKGFLDWGLTTAKGLEPRCMLGSEVTRMMARNEAPTVCIGSPVEGFIAMEQGIKWIPGKRSKGYIKLVPRPTLDLRVVGLMGVTDKHGNPQPRVGAFICEWGDGLTKVGSGALTHAEATELWALYNSPEGKDKVLNRVIQVGYKIDPSYDKPREPTFQMFRDKTEYNVGFDEYAMLG